MRRWMFVVLVVAFASVAHFEAAAAGAASSDEATGDVLRPGWLGIAFDVNDAGRQIVSHVIPGSAAQRAGFVAGDVLLRINDVSVGDAAQADAVWAGLRAGDRVVCTVERNGRHRKLDATLAKMPGWLHQAWARQQLAAGGDVRVAAAAPGPHSLDEVVSASREADPCPHSAKR